MHIFKVYTRAIILNSNNEILMIRKKSNQKYWAWQFMLPGWTLEFWENLEDCLIREIKEEVNLQVKSLKFLENRKIVIWEEHWLWLYYFAEVEDLKSLKNMEPEKHDFCDFVDISEINWEFLHKDLIEKFLKNLLNFKND